MLSCSFTELRLLHAPEKHIPTLQFPSLCSVYIAQDFAPQRLYELLNSEINSTKQLLGFGKGSVQILEGQYRQDLKTGTLSPLCYKALTFPLILISRICKQWVSLLHISNSVMQQCLWKFSPLSFDNLHHAKGWKIAVTTEVWLIKNSTHSEITLMLKQKKKTNISTVSTWQLDVDEDSRRFSAYVLINIKKGNMQ